MMRFHLYTLIIHLLIDPLRLPSVERQMALKGESGLNYTFDVTWD